MAQRLLRRLCGACKQAYQPDRAELPDDFPWELLDGRPLYRSAGCREMPGPGVCRGEWVFTN